MKNKLLLLLLLFTTTSLLAQEVSDTLSIESCPDSISAEQIAYNDSLNKINTETINHLKKIFSKFPNKRPSIGLALAGGGAKGFAHSGILQLIDSLDIPVDFIVGNSMGGLTAALYSIGYSGKDLERYIKGLDWNRVLDDRPEREELPFIEKKKNGMYQLSVGLEGYQPTVPSGMIFGQNIQMEFLSMTAPYEDVTDFDNLPIPFRCVAVDLVTGKEITLKSGSLSKAMRATMSIPSAFSPVDWDNYLLVDGMVLNNFPVDVVKEMGADIIIGLNLTTGRVEKKKLKNLFSILDRSVDIPMGNRLKENIELSDIYISQDLEGFSTSDFAPDRVAQIIERGKEAGARNKDVLIALKEELEKYDDYNNWKNIERGEKSIKILEKREKALIAPPTINKISIVGNKKFESDFIESYLSLDVGEVFETRVIQKKIDALYALNYFESVTYEIIKLDDSSIELKIIIKEKPVNRVVAGFRYNDHFKIIGLLGLETNSAFIKGAQMEAYFRFGGLTEFDVSVLYPSRSMDIPVYPFLKVSYKEIPINFYYDGKKAFSFRDRSWDFSGGLNFRLSKFWDLEASMHYEQMNVTTDIASGDIEKAIENQHPDAKIVLGNLRLLFDSLDDIILPNSGLYFKANFEISMKEIGSEIQYHKFYSLAEYYVPIGKKQNLKLEASFAFAGPNTPFYKWFYIGGPNTFVGIDYFQANGTEFSIGQASYRYEFLKDLYLKGLFNIMFNYNMGSYELPLKGKPILGGGISLIMRTMFGRAELTFARGDEDLYTPGKKINRVYFTFGYNLK